MNGFLTYLAVVVSCAALLLNIATFIRAGKWRESEEAKALVDNISGHESRLTKLETAQLNLATKADIASLESELHGLEKTVNAKIDGVNHAVNSVGEGVDRIEGYFLQKGIS